MCASVESVPRSAAISAVVMYASAVWIILSARSSTVCGGFGAAYVMGFCGVLGGAFRLIRMTNHGVVSFLWLFGATVAWTDSPSWRFEALTTDDGMKACSPVSTRIANADPVWMMFLQKISTVSMV